MGRKCSECEAAKTGYCPFGLACRREVWELFLVPNRVKRCLDYSNSRRDMPNKIHRHEAVRLGEVKS
jgi:hypothetical protein